MLHRRFASFETALRASLYLSFIAAPG